MNNHSFCVWREVKIKRADCFRIDRFFKVMAVTSLSLPEINYGMRIHLNY